MKKWAAALLLSAGAALAGAPDPASPAIPASPPGPLSPSNPVSPPVSANEVARPQLLEFRGNTLFDELVYRSVLQLPETSRATAGRASAIAKTLLAFLRRAGYDLATVRATLAGEKIVIDIDEGRLDKIIVIGDGLLATIRFRMELSLPGGVFNRAALERQLRALGERYQLMHYRYELVPAEVQDQHGPEPALDEYEPLFGLPGVRTGVRYQLRIFISSSPWSRGFALELSFGSPEGLGGGGTYRGQGSLLDDDRWELRGHVAAGTRSDLEGPGSSPVFTRAILEARWYSPPVFNPLLRPAFKIGADWLSLQRGDLGLQSFDQATFSASFGASVLEPGGSAAIGVGIERRFLFALDKTAAADPVIDQTPKAQTRPYGELVTEVTFNPEELRNDRKHRIHLEARAYTGSPSSEPALWLRGSWQRRFPIGWHELWWEGHGTLLAGQVLFPDEESLGIHLRGAFGGDVAQKVLSTGLEFRYSLLRDIFKAGIFYNQALYGAVVDHGLGTWARASAGAGGLAVHLLIADEFQLDIYGALGWKTDGDVAFSPSLELRQVF
jgi:hypothetical protein